MANQPTSDMTNVSASDKSKPYFPLAGIAKDGYSKEGEATATCFCGAVQLAFVGILFSLPDSSDASHHMEPTEKPGLVDTFVCNCTDCRKITASMFASNFTVLDSHLKHLRGRENLTSYAQSDTIATHNLMTNYFCKTCGSLMYRVGERFPNKSILRIGTVDGFNLMETKLRPQVEIFTKDRVSWLTGLEAQGVKQLSQTGRSQL